MYSITRRTLHTWCGVAVLLITLAGCDNSALNGPVESAALGPASPSTVGRTADRASSLTSTLEVTEAGFDAVTNSTYPNLSASL